MRNLYLSLRFFAVIARALGYCVISVPFIPKYLSEIGIDGRGPIDNPLSF